MLVDVFLCLNNLYPHMISVVCIGIPLQTRLSISLTQKLLNILANVVFCIMILYSVYYVSYEGWNFNSGNYLFTTDTK